MKLPKIKEFVDDVLFIKTTRRKHQSGFRIIEPKMEETVLSKNCDAVCLWLKGGEYRVDVEKDGTFRIYPWANADKRMFMAEEREGASTIFLREIAED